MTWQGSLNAKILDSLSLWQPLKDKVTPIKDIHISDKGRSGICRLSAAEAHIPAMGYVVELAETGKVLNQTLQAANIDLRCPAKVVDMTKDGSGWELTIEENEQRQSLTTSLVIAADGGNSAIREMLNVDIAEKTYRQNAIISTIQSQLDHNHQAFERFTDEGPVAMLPLSDNRISLVWMLPPELAEEMVGCAEAEFLSGLQAAFGYRLGRLERVGQRHMYPLVLRQTKSSIDGVIFVGNAAQSLHPIAGQGFNLGLRDVADLVDVLRDCAIENLSLSEADNIQLLQADYGELRARDKELIITMTDGLARLFANPSPLLSLPRNLVLHLLATTPSIRHEFGRFAMGANHPASRLTRGLNLEVEPRP